MDPVGDTILSGSLEPVLVGQPSPSLGALALPGRRFRVRCDVPPESWCPCGPQYRGYAASLGLTGGQLGEFNRVSLDRNGDWEARLRFPDGAFMDDVELFRFLACVELIAEDDSQLHCTALALTRSLL